MTGPTVAERAQEEAARQRAAAQQTTRSTATPGQNIASSGQPSASDQVADLQRSAGNQALAASAAGQIPQPVLPAPVLGSRQAVSVIAPMIEADRGSASAWRDFNLDVVAMLDAQEKDLADKQGIPLPPERAFMRDQAQSAADAAGARYAAAVKDLLALQNPTTPPTTLNEIIARRKARLGTETADYATGSAFLKSQGVNLAPLPWGWTIDSKGNLSRSSAQGTTVVRVDDEGRPQVTTTEVSDSKKRSVLGLTGVSSSGGRKSTTSDGATTSTSERSGTSSYTWIGVTPGYAGSETTKNTTVDAAGKTNTSTTATATTIDAGGGSLSRTTSTQQGTALTSTTTAGAFKRGDGSATLGLSVTKKSGEADAEGNLTGGTTASASASGGLFRDKDKGTGLGRDVTVEAGLVPAKGLSIGPKIGGGGRWFVDVKRVPDSPTELLLVTTIVLSASVSIGASGAGQIQSAGDSGRWGVSGGGTPKEGAQVPGKGSLSGSLGASGTWTAVFAHRMFEKEAKDYLAIMDKNGDGGSLPEHKLLVVGFRDGWGAADKMWRAMSMQATVDVAGSLGKGEYVERGSDTSTSGSIGGNVDVGEFGIGATYGKSSRDQVTGRVTGSDDKNVEVSLTVNHTDTVSKGGTLKAGFAGASVSGDHAVSAGAVYVFTVPRGEKKVIGELLSAATLEDLYRLFGTYSDYRKNYSETRGETDSGKASLSVGDASLNIGGTGAYSGKIDYDAKAKQTGATFTGTNTASGTIGLGTTQLGSSRTETYTGEVEEHGGGAGEQRATGKSQRTTTTVSAKKTWAAVKGAAADPLKVLTDGTAGLVQTETTDDKSTLIGPGDYDHIVAEAHDEPTWMKHVASPSRRPDWRRTMLAIRAAAKWREGADGRPGRWEYDANKVQEALARWTASKDTDRLEAVDYLVRAPGATEGGVHATFPGTLAPLEADFKKYVLRDPVADSKQLFAAEREQKAQFAVGTPDPAKLAELFRAALPDLTNARTHLDKLTEGLTGKGAEFASAGVYSEMMGKLVSRVTAVRNEIRAVEEQIATLTIDAKSAVATSAVRGGGKTAQAAVTRIEAQGTQERNEAEAQSRDKQAKDDEATARSNFDQMWRDNADLHRLIDYARTLNKERHPDFAKMNGALDDAKGRLKDWTDRRTRNVALVARSKLGDWLNGPDPAPLQAEYDRAFAEIHRGY